MQAQRTTIDHDPLPFAAATRGARAYAVRCLGCGASARVALECVDPAALPLRCLTCRGDAVVAEPCSMGIVRGKART